MLFLLSALSLLVVDTHSMISLYALPDQWKGMVALFFWKQAVLKPQPYQGEKKVLSIKINEKNSSIIIMVFENMYSKQRGK